MSVANAIAVILAMAIITYATRVGGAMVAGKMPIGADTDRFLQLLSGCMIAALLYPALVHADAALVAGTLVAAVTMSRTRSMLGSIVAAAIAVALFRLSLPMPR